MAEELNLAQVLETFFVPEGEHIDPDADAAWKNYTLADIALAISRGDIKAAHVTPAEIQDALANKFDVGRIPADFLAAMSAGQRWSVLYPQDSHRALTAVFVAHNSPVVDSENPLQSASSTIVVERYPGLHTHEVKSHELAIAGIATDDQGNRRIVSARYGGFGQDGRRGAYKTSISLSDAEVQQIPDFETVTEIKGSFTHGIERGMFSTPGLVTDGMERETRHAYSARGYNMQHESDDLSPFISYSTEKQLLKDHPQFRVAFNTNETNHMMNGIDPNGNIEWSVAVPRYLEAA